MRKHLLFILIPVFIFLLYMAIGNAITVITDTWLNSTYVNATNTVFSTELIAGDWINASNLNISSGLVVLPSGNVGIGTTSPTQMLTVVGSANITGDTFVANGTRRGSCPQNMTEVPPSPQDGVNGFCIDKYNEKNVIEKATSQMENTPWVSITWYSARNECIRAGKHLCTNNEWLAVAHNAEKVGWNWNGGVAGTNYMSDGHSDNVPYSALAADVDTNPCSGTDQTCDVNTWNSQRRTYKLSNGQYIWDFGGNVWQWVDQINTDNPFDNSGTAGWVACSTSGDGICGNTLTTNDQWYRGATTATRAVFRGGSWYYGADDGSFAMALNNAPSYSATDIGFRCCF